MQPQSNPPAGAENSPAALASRLALSCADGRAVNLARGHDLPARRDVEEVLDLLLAVLFPGYGWSSGVTESPPGGAGAGAEEDGAEGLSGHFTRLLNRIRPALAGQIERAFAYDCRLRGSPCCDACRLAAAAVAALLDGLPALREVLKADVAAALERDPAAASPDLVVFCYPGLEAVATQRLANVLYRHAVPILPRMWTERAHSRTGIDIHPGAAIGPGFFIDHGTGVVVGESTLIGSGVTLYQGVTLGALSPARGQVLRGTKRHPTIEDDVIIYAGATVLGGETVVGKGTVIGGSVWLTESVPPGSRVMNAPAGLVVSVPGSNSQ